MEDLHGGWLAISAALLVLALGLVATRRFDRLGRVNSKLALEREAALEVSAAKTEFLANLSHEVRTPMNGVLGFAWILLETKLEPEQREFVEAIRTSGRMLLSIIHEILGLSRIEAGRMELSTPSFDFPNLLEQLGREARGRSCGSAGRRSGGVRVSPRRACARRGRRRAQPAHRQAPARSPRLSRRRGQRRLRSARATVVRPLRADLDGLRSPALHRGRDGRLPLQACRRHSPTRDSAALATPRSGQPHRRIRALVPPCALRATSRSRSVSSLA